MSTPISRAQSYVRHPEPRQFRRAMLYEEAEDFKRLQRVVFDYDNYIVPLFPRLYKISPKSTKVAQLQCIPIIGNLFIFWLTSRFIYQSMKFDCLSTSTTLYMMAYSGAMFAVGFIPFIGVWATYKLKPLYTCWTLFSKDINNKGLYHGESIPGARAEFPVRDTMVSNMSSIRPTNRNTDLIEMPVLTPSRPPPARSIDDNQLRFAAPPEKGRYAPADLSPPPPSYGNKPQEGERHGYSSFCPVPTNNQRAYASRDSEYYDDGISTRKHSFDSMRASTMPEEADFLKNNYMDRLSYLDNWPLKK
ncbi:hypothetical protein IW146_005765 [Coemansia sp. RSA 922]|nr:hypothetical protein LPJ71_005845 [Coemansia sp. S17]KAJ2017837.1 hypothetical protein GGI14_002721 [Coemansia sp. S680]KAJ2054448.1 hypothetical protein GGI08_004588 [Coemansia sp. S2]KAJ2093893.1 hypothetical protein GGI09_005706 [Coemansia sp. S100]KAJ2109551.1 hypothetical protein GGI16_000684 [Coemansia sp. S142-1]KAJ2110768.1 hypothetical protein IW146_005765 [Coemansia sp. RSA 922]